MKNPSSWSHFRVVDVVNNNSCVEFQGEERKGAGCAIQACGLKWFFLMHLLKIQKLSVAVLFWYSLFLSFPN